MSLSFEVVLLLPLALYIALSGLDDLLLDFFSLRFRQQLPPPEPAPPDSRIAVFIPLWHEADVIGPMLDHNLAALEGDSFEVFVGVYRNDPATALAVRQAQHRHPRVHLAEVPHDGPTSKADCLNWIYQRMLLFEQQSGSQLQFVVIHDAEDLIHPREFYAFRDYGGGYEMIQLPVLPLGTSWSEWTHGLYCDDFAESQGGHLYARSRLGAFLPGCGVGTCFRRDAVERLAEADANRIFQPGALTEDYENGLRLHTLGCRQLFVPLQFERTGPVATREYFPRRISAAVLQRSRWITGNALQSWERNGWNVSATNRTARLWNLWFLWRDRKGLWGNPLSLFCNALFAFGLSLWAWTAALGTSWEFPQRLSSLPPLRGLLWLNLVLLSARTLLRAAASARVYGWPFALLSPLRSIWGNGINSLATLRALGSFALSRIRREPLRWVKTEHAYPSLEALRVHKRPLSEILVETGCCTTDQVRDAYRVKSEGTRLGDWLVQSGVISEDDLYRALAVQNGIPAAGDANLEATQRIARMLPDRIKRDLQVLPFQVEAGTLHIAGPRIPDLQMEAELQQWTRLEIRFHLIAPSRFRSIAGAAVAGSPTA